MSRGTRATFFLFLAAMSLLIGSIAVVVAFPILEGLWSIGGFLPAGVYASLVLVVAIATPILGVVAAFVVLLSGTDS